MAGSWQDRTTEFDEIAERLRCKMISDGSSSPVLSRRDAISSVSSARKQPLQRSQFTVLASQIARDIGGTTDDLQQLTQLAKKKSPFSDSKQAAEIAELTGRVKQDLTRIGSQLVTLQQAAAERRQNKQLESHADTVVKSLRWQLKFTAKDFRDILALRTTNLKAQQEKQRLFEGTSSLRSPIVVSTRHSSPLVNSGHDHLLQVQQPPSDAASQMFGAVQLYDINSSRLADVQAIERTMMELGKMFEELAHLVAEQGEMLERIDRNLDDSAINVERAQSSLLQLLASVGSKRWLIVQIFFVLLLFIVLFVVFFV